MGDIVLTSPVIRCMKEQTGAHVDFLTKGSFTTIVESNPHVDNVIIWDEKSWQEVISKNKYDVVVDLHNNLRSRRVTRRVRSKVIRYNKGNIRKWLTVNLGRKVMDGKHVVDRYFEALKGTNIVNDGQGLDYYIPDHVMTSVKERYFSLSATSLVISLGATYFTKRVPTDKIIALVNSTDFNILLIGGEDVASEAQKIVSKSTKPVTNLCGKTTIHETAAIISLSDVLLTGDTATMHIGAAVHTRMVSIWGSTIPEFGMSAYYGDKDTRNVNLQVSGLSCRPCSKLGFESCPKGHFRCMNDIMDEKILSAVKSQL